MENIFITITGVSHYFGMKPYKIGGLVKLVKDEENSYDSCAIRAELPFIETVGYVANSTHTVFAGTYSAGRLYDKIGDYAYAQIMFITHSSVIGLVLPPEAVENNKDGSAENEGDILNVEGRKNKSAISSRFKIGF